MSEQYEFHGGQTKATVYGNYPDAAELSQIYAMMNCHAFKDATIRIMPDHHAGAGCVVGFTCPYTGKAVPNIVGVDIGCGVQALNIGSRPLGKNEFKAFDKYLRLNIPSGFSNRKSVYKELKLVYTRFIDPAGRVSWDAFVSAVDRIAVKVGSKAGSVWTSAGALGGGNHFIELDQDEASGKVFLVVHSGSRNFGLKVCKYHQKAAKDQRGSKNGLEWLDGAEADAYLADMRIAQRFAMLNRMTMLVILAAHFNVKMRDAEIITSIHNFIAEDDNVIRKGAISAKKGETVIIPWNMRDGLIIGIGKGNQNWNNSAPHGAGRIMSRSDARRSLTLTTYKGTMEGIWSSCVSEETIDESPDAYKPATIIEAAIDDTIEIRMRLKPIYNFKAGKEESE
jgi:RNA-splicing ligase RtcB